MQGLPRVPNLRLGPKFDQRVCQKKILLLPPSFRFLTLLLEERIGTANHCCNLMCTSPILWPSISTGHYTDYRIGNVVTQGSNKVLFFVWLREPRLFGPSHAVEGCFFLRDTEKDFFCFVKLLQRALLFRVCLKMWEIQNLKGKGMPEGKKIWYFSNGGRQKLSFPLRTSKISQNF